MSGCTCQKYEHTDDCAAYVAPPPPTVPRVASSLDDLRVGMVVAWLAGGGNVRGGTVQGFGEGCLVTINGDVWDIEKDTDVVVMLDPPPPEPVSVSRAAIDRLADAMRAYDEPAQTDQRVLSLLKAAARELIAEVRAQEPTP